VPADGDLNLEAHDWSFLKVWKASEKFEDKLWNIPSPRSFHHIHLVTQSLPCVQVGRPPQLAGGAAGFFWTHAGRR